jgi:5-methylcytosine-specific restriction endonuclease McrA
MLELDEVQRLRDEALIERLSLSVRNDRRLAVRMLVEMGEVLARGLYRDLGFSTMFEFSTRKLGMSEPEAALRIRAAKLGRSFPVALEMLGRCEVNLTTLSLLATVLTEESLHLLYAARFKTKQQVLALIAAHAPKPDVPDSVRRLPQRASARAQRAEGVTGAPPDRHVHPNTNQGVSLASAQSAMPIPQAAPPIAPQPPRPAALVQLSAERHKISFTCSQRVRDLLQEAQDLRRHRYPAGDLEPIFERALELLVAGEKKRKFALTAKPRTRAPMRAPKHSRYIPYAVRRQVWARDAGQCCFVGKGGQRCEARSRLEFQHINPYARGGLSTADNVELLCASHNALLAERDYGRGFIRRRIELRSPRVSRHGSIMTLTA